MSLSVLHYSGLSLISLLDSLSGSYSTVNLSSFPETETVCQSSCLLFQQMLPSADVENNEGRRFSSLSAQTRLILLMHGCFVQPSHGRHGHFLDPLYGSEATHTCSLEDQLLSSMCQHHNQ